MLIGRLAGCLILAAVGLSACGGSSGSSNDGIIIEGLLTEGVGVDDRIAFRHEKDEPIENVEICALGECSITDAAGQYGFRVSTSFQGGAAQFSIIGHGIDTRTVVDIPENAAEVFIHFEHGHAGQVKAHHILVDGQELQGHADQHEDEHEH